MEETELRDRLEAFAEREGTAPAEARGNSSRRSSPGNALRPAAADSSLPCGYCLVSSPAPAVRSWDRVRRRAGHSRRRPRPTCTDHRPGARWRMTQGFVGAVVPPPVGIRRGRREPGSAGGGPARRLGPRNVSGHRWALVAGPDPTAPQGRAGRTTDRGVPRRRGRGLVRRARGRRHRGPCSLAASATAWDPQILPSASGDPRERRGHRPRLTRRSDIEISRRPQIGADGDVHPGLPGGPLVGRRGGRRRRHLRSGRPGAALPGRARRVLGHRQAGQRRRARRRAHGHPPWSGCGPLHRHHRVMPPPLSRSGTSSPARA